MSNLTLFRVDFGNETGMGHLMRSLVYAKEFDDVVYASKSDRKEFLPYELLTIKNEDDFFEYVEKLQPKQVVVDNYDFTLEDEKEFKKRFPHIKLSVFDDDYREHCCDEIINHNISADKSRYPNPDIVKIIPPLIRKEFHKEKKIKREKIYDVFVAMGGTDAANLNIPILETLPESLRVALVTTSANPHLTKLKTYVQDKKNVTLHIDSKEVAKLMNESKFAIVTPSVIVHEVLFMELPFVAIQTADNQKEIVTYLEKHRYRVLKKFDKTLLLQQINTYISKRLQLINFVDLNEVEKKMILEWRNDPKIRKWMRNSEIIQLQDHLDFIKSLQKRDDRHYFVVKEEQEYIGVIDFTDIDMQQKSAFFGIYANPFLKKSGMGSKLLAAIIEHARNTLKLNTLKLEVLKTNTKAIALYKKVGFQEYDKKGKYIYMELTL